MQVLIESCPHNLDACFSCITFATGKPDTTVGYRHQRGQPDTYFIYICIKDPKKVTCQTTCHSPLPPHNDVVSARSSDLGSEKPAYPQKWTSRHAPCHGQDDSSCDRMHGVLIATTVGLGTTAQAKLEKLAKLCFILPAPGIFDKYSDWK